MIAIEKAPFVIWANRNIASQTAFMAKDGRYLNVRATTFSAIRINRIRLSRLRRMFI